MRAACRRLLSLDPPDRVLVLEAAWLIVAAWTGLRMVRLTAVRRLLGRMPVGRRGSAADHDQDIARVQWAVTRVAARWLFARCLVQALAVEAMLRRRGVASTLHIGVRSPINPSTRPLEAHAWVESHGIVAVGTLGNLRDFHVVTTFTSP